MRLQMKDAACGYGLTKIIEHVNLHVDQGEIVCILGPNGIGKTTIFRSILGFNRLIEGEITIDNVPRDEISNREFSRIVGYVPQSHNPPFAYSVQDVIVMGRAGQLKRFSAPGMREYMIVDKVMNMLGIEYLKDHKYTEISGGERQMVLVARAIVQEPYLLVMDEPTANLDYGNQVHVLENIKALSKSGLGVLMTTHNPDHAFLCCDRAILVTREKKILEGPVDEIVTEDNLRAAYGVEVKITETEDDHGNIIKSTVPMLEDNVLIPGTASAEKTPAAPAEN